MLLYVVDNFNFENANIHKNKLNPLKDNDGDRLKNLADVLPNYYGEVTESEYRYLLDKWSKQTLKIVEEIIFF
ncbi:MAG: hypothetical protein UMU04_02580 [Halanaerobiales bacterium]|nr:hypothetical protein [Halanaerobiales bacterium]